MTGVAAIAICAAFTACSKSEELYDQGAVDQISASQIQENYNKAFIATFGQPAANQDWGFGSPAKTRGVFANGNEWAANDRDDCKYKVPPALTPEQKAVVIKYFQTVKNPSYQDPHWTNYFIQQVYKGGSNPGTNSSEAYPAADGNTKIVGSDNMDHLAAINGDFVDHNNNFNHGDCGNGYPDVLNYKGTLTTVEETYPVNSGDEYRHADKINLMTNSTTASFGYYNSNSSVRRTEYTGLVNFQTIIDVLGAEANCLNDGWNRSFMGFDFEMMVGDEIYAKGVSRQDENGNWKWYADEYDMYEFNGQQYHMLSSDQNKYCGEFYKNPDGTDLNDAQLTDEFISGLLADGYLPVSNSANKKWVKVGGTADGYYSDWIVTLTEAQKYDYDEDQPDELVVRIIAEDLNAQTANSAAAADGLEESDWDFNDVVFDVRYTSETTAMVKIVGAGGVLPLYVAGHEVHELLGQSGPDEEGHYRIQNSGTSQEFEVTNISKSKKGSDIPVFVKRPSASGGDITLELKAPVGQPAAKICVKPTFQPCAERQDIRVKYPLFSKWVQDANLIWYYDE